jgi:hypothetical protein
MPPASNNERRTRVDETRPPRPAGTSTFTDHRIKSERRSKTSSGRKACEWLRT